MRLVEFVGSEEINLDIPNTQSIESSERISDPQEIEGIIRRAVTIMWKGSVFTYDELAAHLLRNYVVLPESTKERDGLFDSIIESLWRQQVELARTALNAMPILLHCSQNQRTYHGIITPLSGTLFEASCEVEDRVEEPVFNLGTIVEHDTPVLPEAQFQAATAQDIATQLFDIFLSYKGQETVIGVQKLKQHITAQNTQVRGATIMTVIERMVDNGYITLRKTGHKKDTRWNVVMDEVTKNEIRADIEEGVFDEGIQYMFNENTQVIES